MDTERQTADLADAAMSFHRSASRLLRVIRGRRAAGGLSSAKLTVLGRLQTGGRATAADLAGYLRVQPQSLTRLLDDLERRGLITRRPSERDRRYVDIEISDRGSEALAHTLGEDREVLARAMLKILTPTEKELVHLCADLMDRLAEEIESHVQPADSPA